MNKHRCKLWLCLQVVSWVLVAVVVVGGVEVSESELEEFRDERAGLVALRDALRSARDLHSNWTGPPCHGERSRWYGVACDGDGRVVGVALDGVQLTGALPTGALRNVTRLATLSLRDNAVHGALPRFDGLERLRVVDLSSNRFSGPIPRGYATALRAITRLELQDNLLNGTVPAFRQSELIVFNVSYNFLQGEVPDTRTLRRFPASAFDHNLKLCGEAVNAMCRAGSPSTDDAPAASSSSDDPVVRPDDAGGRPAHRSRRFRLATWSVVVIALIAAMVPFAAVLIFLNHTKKSREVRLGGRGLAAAGQGGARQREWQPEHGLWQERGAAAVLPRGQGRVRPRRAVPVHGGDARQGPAGDHLSRHARGRPRRRREAAAQHGARAAQGLHAQHAAPGQAPARERRRGRRVLLLQGGEAGRLRARPRLQPLPAPAREQRRGEDAAAVAGEAVDSKGHGARTGLPTPVAAVLPPAAARQPQVVQRAHLLGPQEQAAAAAAAPPRGAEAYGPRIPPAAPAPRAPAGGGQVPGVRAREAAVAPGRRVLPRARAAGGGDGEGTGGRGRRPGGVGAAGAEPRVVHGHTRRGDHRRAGPARGHAEAHGGRAAVRLRRARQAAQDTGCGQDDRRDRWRRRGWGREVGACRALSSTRGWRCGTRACT